MSSDITFKKTIFKNSFVDSSLLESPLISSYWTVPTFFHSTRDLVQPRGTARYWKDERTLVVYCRILRWFCSFLERRMESHCPGLFFILFGILDQTGYLRVSAPARLFSLSLPYLSKIAKRKRAESNEFQNISWNSNKFSSKSERKENYQFHQKLAKW